MVAYFILSGIVTLMDFFLLKETNFVIRDKPGDIFAGVNMRPSESHLTLTLRRGYSKEEYKLSLEKLFDEEGNLIQSTTLSTFEGHLTNFTKGGDAKKKE